MHRRKLLGVAALGAGAITLPLWLSRAFQPDPDAEACDPPLEPPACPPGPADRPLLVLVIPRDTAAQWTRGQAFGELLNHGSDAQLAPLACLDVACHTLASLPAVQPQVTGEPLMLVLARDAALPVRQLDAELPDPHTDSDDEARIDARIAALARLLDLAVADPHLDAQACRERATLDPAVTRRLTGLPATLGELTRADLESAPASALRLARTTDPDTRAHLTALLAASVRARLCERPIPGAPWARSSGCGVMVEGEPDQHGLVDCGMGHTPPRSQRFLKFYTGA